MYYHTTHTYILSVKTTLTAFSLLLSSRKDFFTCSCSVWTPHSSRCSSHYSFLTSSKLSNLDKEIEGHLKSLKELYTTAKDEGMLSKLNELLVRQSSFPLENEIATVQKDRNDRLVQNESLTDDQALREALSEEGVQERLVEHGVS